MAHERTHADLFSGIGCWAVAASQHGVRTIVLCEREEWLARGLEQTWCVPCHRDVKDFPSEKYRGVCWLLTGSPPCQPASRAGKQRGAGDDRWLWGETIRIAEVIQPTWFCFENPPGILDVGIDGILADVEGLSYEAQPVRVPACAVDSPQDRDRVWILGHRNGAQGRTSRQGSSGKGWSASGSGSSIKGAVADSEVSARRTGLRGIDKERVNFDSHSAWGDYKWLACRGRHGTVKVRRTPTGLYDLAHGAQSRIPRKFHRKLIAALGNAIVWQVAAEIIGAMIAAEDNNG